MALEPSFDPATLRYDVYTTPDNLNATLTPYTRRANYSDVTLMINGVGHESGEPFSPINLVHGQVVVVTISILAQDGISTTVYEVHFHVELSPPPPPTPPTPRLITEIVGSPETTTNNISAHFEFGTPGAEFHMCSLDGAPLVNCTGRASADYALLTEGPHYLYVVATGGTSSSEPAHFDWTIDTVPPTITVHGPSKVRVPEDGVFPVEFKISKPIQGTFSKRLVNVTNRGEVLSIYLEAKEGDQETYIGMVSFPRREFWWMPVPEYMSLYVPEGALLDLAGNPNARSNLLEVYSDNIIPTAVLKWFPDSEYTKNQKLSDPQYLEITFSEPVLFTPEQVALTEARLINGTFRKVNSLKYSFQIELMGTTSACPYTMEVTDHMACAIVEIGVSIYEDEAGNRNEDGIKMYVRTIEDYESDSENISGFLVATLIGVAVLLLVAGLIYWKWRQQKKASVAPTKDTEAPAADKPPPPVLVNPDTMTPIEYEEDVVKSPQWGQKQRFDLIEYEEPPKAVVYVQHI
ncbi:hypothetical protein CYMTET_28801 [Cymbomonas tetramitiformis]|uniref:Cadherin-like beta-sandwich-like domain-containing protein n=1 Tax=Cymbomonas tetramitiformis TaxID=36881 RepID=A0AAE0KVJ6_9CHLO|nr:hypothetical protein CYMTET_28801 [Cymbomonas tetramitiformis]